MILTNNIGIVIQCRDYANRYNKKSVRPFYNGKSILEILIDRFKHLSYKTVIATESKSLKTIEICKKMKTDYHIGNEENVLERIYETVCVFGFEGIFRVCADNPFIQLGFMFPIENFAKSGQYDYVAFEGSMLRHEGFFMEYISRRALSYTYEFVSTMYECEHVTPFIINNPNHYRQKILAIPWELNNYHLRLTVDTKSDFKIAQEVYKYIKEKHWYSILEWVIIQPKIYIEMQKNIERNPK